MIPYRSWCFVVGARLVQARRLSGLSRKALSLKSGCPVKVLRMIERSRECRLDREFVDALVTWLSVKREWLHHPAEEELGQFFFCTGQNFCECGEENPPLVCDADLGTRTCDAPLCERCAFKWGTLDICSRHRGSQRKQAGKC